MNRTARISFVISIILNVLMLGVIIGQSPRRFARWHHAAAKT